MNNDFIIFLPNIILLALFIIFLWRHHSLKNFDWATLICITLGISLLAIVIVLIIKSQPEEAVPLQILLITIPAVLFVLFLLFLTRVITIEKVKSKLHFDERITTMNAKSARNALVAVYLSSAIYSNIDKILLLVILGVSLVVYLASMVIYYYRSF
jgi:low temperature requirement protein LtrA